MLAACECEWLSSQNDAVGLMEQLMELFVAADEDFRCYRVHVRHTED